MIWTIFRKVKKFPQGSMLIRSDNQGKQEDERHTWKSFSAQSFGNRVGIEKFLTLESEAIQIFILEDPKGRNAKQNS
jgi:hypothetical protein